MKPAKRLLAAALSLSLFWTALPPGEAGAAAGKDKVGEVMDIIRENHLYDYGEDELTRAAIQGMIDALNDPYTEYFSSEQAKQFFDMLNGSQLRIGIGYEAVDGRIKVTEVETGSPAAAAGLLAGDVIVQVNGSEATSENFADLMSGAAEDGEGAVVTLTVQRQNNTLTFKVPFRKIEMPLVFSRYFQEGIGYLYLSIFNERSAEELTDALNDLKKKGMRTLILDLRNNGGGDVEAAKTIASRFIKDGVFMYVRDKSGNETAERIGGGASLGMPVYVLVNDYTASAAEMLAGALQDHRVGKIIGTQTYGKGVMQRFFYVETDDAIMKVTTNEYFTPNHRKVDKIGIKPNVAAADSLSQLFKGLHLAGIKRWEVAFGGPTYSVNGVEFPGEIPVVRKQGRVYVLARLASAMLDAKIEWNGKEQAVVLSRNGVLRKFAGDTLVLKDGYSYIEAGRLKAAYPGLLWKEAGGRITLKLSAPVSVVQTSAVKRAALVNSLTRRTSDR